MRRRRTPSAPFSLFAFQDIITSVTGIMILVTLLIAIDLVNRQADSPRVQTPRLNEAIREQLQRTRTAIARLSRQLQHDIRGVNRDALLKPEVLKSKLKTLEQQNKQADRKSLHLAEVSLRKQKQLQKIQQEQAKRSGDIAELRRLRKEIQQKKQKLAKLVQSNRLIYNPAAITNRAKIPWLLELTGTTVRLARMGRRAPPRTFSGEAAFEAWAANQTPSGNYFLVLFRPAATNAYQSVLDFLDEQGFQYGYDLIGGSKVVIDPKDGAGF